MNKAASGELKLMLTTKDKIKSIKENMLNINDSNFNMAWNDGYLNALSDYKVINEQEFEALISWIETVQNFN